MNLASQLSLWLESRKQQLCHRQLLVISGDRHWAYQNALRILDELSDKHPLWVGETQNNLQTIHIKDYHLKLGYEYDTVVLDCFSGFRANAAMALSGTVKAQGLMILLCPPLIEWPLFNDPELTNRLSYGYNIDKVPSLFFSYLATAFTQDETVAILTPKAFSACLAKAESITDNAKYAEQQKAIHDICKLAQGRANRPLLLTADRGRGKSSALGLAAAKLMQVEAKTIWLTAPQVGNTEQVFHHAKRLMPEAKHSKLSLTIDESSLIFKPIDQLFENIPHPDLLLVDEAAAIPLHILIRLVKNYSRVVFSSTVHGYEGSGRGFELKFFQLLKTIRPAHRKRHLQQPIRWHKQDVLEKFWFKVMLHSSHQNTIKPSENNNQISCRYISSKELLDKPAILSTVFKLLLDAHYQTSPDDLQRLLDSPEIKCFILTKGAIILGVTQVIEEGGPALAHIANNIADCSRRVKGHLVSQNIASLYNLADFCLRRQWRISRIAISTEQQRQGLGNQLLSFVEAQARTHNIEFISTAFGASTELLKFWFNAQFNMLKISNKAEISSGEHSCICVKPLTTSATKELALIPPVFSENLRFNLNRELSILPTGIALALLRQTNQMHGSVETKIIHQFVMGNRNMSTCLRQLYQLILFKINHINELELTEWLFLTALLFQNKSNKWLGSEFNLSGKKQIEKKMRVIVEKLLNLNSK